jgi:hypothetical protein
MNNNGNILLTQIIVENSLNTFKEFVPVYDSSCNSQTLIRQLDGNIRWLNIDLSLNILVNNKFLGTDIYYDKGRIGLGRQPLRNYKVDIEVSSNKIITAFHVGDGSYGFAMGNGTTDGFVPEIIGIGSNENDAGLYFVGIAGNDVSSNVPLILLDGRNFGGTKLTNRPILGITSGNYNEYSVLIQSNGDIILNGLSLLEILADYQKQINDLKAKIT